MPGSPPTADLADRPEPPQDRPAEIRLIQDRPAAGTIQTGTDETSTNQTRTNQTGPDQTGPDQTGPDQTATAEIGCTTRLLGIVRRLIGYGRLLTATLHRNPAAFEPSTIQRRFGTADIALILQRIARGILLAVALEAKLVARVEHPQRAPARTSDPGPDAVQRRRQKRAHRPKPGVWRVAADAALLDRLPTAAEIAARMRCRPIGAVILDIFRDLGILPGDKHRMWQLMSPDIITRGGNVSGLLAEIGKRQHKWFVEKYRGVHFDWSQLGGALAEALATGPP